MTVQVLRKTTRKKAIWTTKRVERQRRRWISATVATDVVAGEMRWKKRVWSVLRELTEIEGEMEEENQMGEAAALGRLGQESEMRAPLPTAPTTNLSEALENDNVRNEIIER